MPISEHPTDESWGYQNTGFFAPTSRYGTPSQLKQLIDTLHQNGIGVLLDFVPVHFAIDPYGLAQYDGSALYEYPHQDVGVSEWGSYNFIHSRGEVRSFLQSAADYWLREYHFDGLRMDAISRIIYWQGDEKRGENGNAVYFIKVMNHGLKERNPGCILIAEDSTNYPNVTVDVDHGGLGFDYKRKAFIRCRDTNKCSACPYGRTPETKQAPVVSWDGLLDSGWEPAPTESTEHIVMAKLEYQAIRALMDAEDPRIALAFEAKVLYGDSVKKIAADLGVSEPRIYQLINRAKTIGKQYRKDNDNE